MLLQTGSCLRPYAAIEPSTGVLLGPLGDLSVRTGVGSTLAVLLCPLFPPVHRGEASTFRMCGRGCRRTPVFAAARVTRAVLWCVRGEEGLQRWSDIVPPTALGVELGLSCFCGGCLATLYSL